MTKITLENITDNNEIYDCEGNFRGIVIYKYIRGSRLYHTNIDTSDTDMGGIYIVPNNEILGLGEYQTEIKDERGDSAFFEIGKFLQLTLTSNPTVLEALFVPDDMVVYEHPIMKEIRARRDEFVTKKAFAPFGGYAVSQIKKAQGKDKKIHWDIINMQRCTPFDFCYTFDGRQGSKLIMSWLEERGLREDCCTCNNIEHMQNMYGVYYDFGQHFRMVNISSWDEIPETLKNYIAGEFLMKPGDKTYSIEDAIKWFEKNKTPIGGYRGIIKNDGSSNCIRFSETPKNSRVICNMCYNDQGYQSHCKQYKEYEDWKKKRNKARYESNMEGENSGNPDMMYDVKNMYHCFRLIAMAKEIAEGKGVILDRTGIDRDFLLEVRNRKFGYSELMKKLELLKIDMDKAIAVSTIKEDIDFNMVNELLLNVRNNFK